MRRTFVVALALANAAAAAGCTNPFAPRRSVTLWVRDVAAPAELERGAELVVTLTVVTGGCRSFERLYAQRSATGVGLLALGRDGSGPGVACTADIRYERHTYRAEPPFGDSFTIVVRQPDGTKSTHEVQVR